MPAAVISVPFTAAQVAALRSRQGYEHQHEYTCPDGHCLDVTEDGWRCPECGYRQDWAHSQDAA